MAVVLNIHNQSADFYYNLALEQLEEGVYYQAILNLIKANELADDPMYRLHLAEAYYNTNNFVQSTNQYIKLFFSKRRLSYILAIYRNLLLMGRTPIARRFILNCFQDFDQIFTDEYDELPEMDENELHKVLGFAESDDINSFINVTDAIHEATIAELKILIEESDFDNAILYAQKVPKDSQFFESAQEIICIAAHARGDHELAEQVARDISARMPDSVIAFGVLALMSGSVSKDEVERRAEALYAQIKSRPDKSLDFVKTLAHSVYGSLFNRYLEEVYAAFPCYFGIIAYKMFDMYSRKKTADGDACLRRLQMLFPNDIKVRAYTALRNCKAPAHCFEELKFAPFCTNIEAVEDKFFDSLNPTKNRQKLIENTKDQLCAMLLAARDDDISSLVSIALCSYNGIFGSLSTWLEEILSDITLLGETKCDLLYGMLMYGWESVADVMMGDSFVRCRISSQDIGKLPIKLARLYTEIYVQVISDGEAPRPEVLFDVIERMGQIGVKYSMVNEALFAVGHYIYELECGSEIENIEDYIEIYEANPATVERYYNIFKKIVE